MTDQPKYTRLRNVILATTLCFAVLPMLVVGSLIPAQFTGLYHEKTVREVENVARAKGRTIDIFFEERISQLKTLAEMYTYEEITRPGALAGILRIMKANSQSYVDLGIIDMEGTHVVYAGSYDVRDANYKNELWFNEVRRKGVYVSDNFLGFRNFPHIIIAVMREDHGRAWILRATVDSAVFSSIVRSSRLSADGDAFVINRSGVLQTDSQFGRHMDTVHVAWPKSGETTVNEYISGRDMLLAKVPLTQAPWLLVVAEDPSEHLSMLSRARAMALLIIAAGFVALGFGTWFTTRKIIRYLEAADRQKAAYDATLLQSSKMAALGKLAAGIAHEINNPLMLIREHAGWIRDLLEEEGKNFVHYDDLQRAASKVEQNVDRAKEITHRLLGFARRVDPVSESLPLNPIVEQAIAFLQNEANFRGIAIERVFSPVDVRVATDVGQLQQVILNVLDNAIDAVENKDKTGKVTVSTGVNKEGQAVVTLRDNGPGIPPERLEQIFDPFYTTKKPGEGTGLGLSICYSIMEGLGGGIKAANPPEGGAEFTITLPAVKNE